MFFKKWTHTVLPVLHPAVFQRFFLPQHLQTRSVLFNHCSALRCMAAPQFISPPSLDGLGLVPVLCYSCKHYGSKYPDWYGSGGWVLSHKVKGHQFDSQSGHMSRLQVWSYTLILAKRSRSNAGLALAGVCTKRQLIDVYLPLFLPLSKK